jgi:hypothetical protein
MTLSQVRTFLSMQSCRETAPFDSHCRDVLEKANQPNKYSIEEQLEVDCIGRGVQGGQTFVHPSNDHVFHYYLHFTEASQYKTAQVATITNYSKHGFRLLIAGYSVKWGGEKKTDVFISVPT